MKKLIALALALTMCLGVFAFAGAEEVITLKIAHIGPLTGAAAVYGTATSRGAKLAAEEISAAGGKYKVEIIDEDDTHDAEKAVYAYNDALDKCIKATHDHDWEGMREISDELQNHLERLNAAFPMSGTPKKNVVVVDPTAQESPTL